MRLVDTYKQTVVPALKEQFGYSTVMAVPKIDKVVVNIGAGRTLQDSKYVEVMEQTLERITGQMPIKTKARKSIASFKIREGMVIGFKVTLRRERMWDFLEKLVHVTLPRVRDFRGLDAKSFDGQGNYSIGFKEHIAFPEISSDEVERVHGLQVVISTTAKTNEEGLALLRGLGFPFKEDK